MVIVMFYGCIISRGGLLRKFLANRVSVYGG